jgi:hypothetical protein
MLSTATPLRPWRTAKNAKGVLDKPYWEQWANIFFSFPGVHCGRNESLRVAFRAEGEVEGGGRGKGYKAEEVAVRDGGKDVPELEYFEW